MKIKSLAFYTYRRYLAPFLLFRLLKEVLMCAYRCLYRSYCLLNNRLHVQKYSMIPLATCHSSLPVQKIGIEASNIIEIPAPGFSGYCAETATHQNPAIQIKTPALDIILLTDVKLVGGMDFILAGNLAIHHDLFDPSQHYAPAENTGVASINRADRTLKVYLTEQPIVIEKAVNLIGQCNGNYAHWLTETLPKLALLDAQGAYPDFPIVVDAGLHPNIYKSLDFINQNRRAVIKLGRWKPALVTNCVTISHPGYERYAPHSVSSREAPAYVNSFSPTALKTLRQAALGALDQPKSGGTKIYLARNKTSSNIRHVENMVAIDTVIETHKISVITPETMSFEEQVASSKDAAVIIAPIGASMANMIFAPTGCTIIALAPFHDHAAYFYYSNLSGALGHKIHYVLGPQTNTRQHPIHRNYSITPETLSAVLEQACSNGH